MPFSPYLHFKGQCEEAFDFYAACFDGVVNKQRYGESHIVAQTVPEWRDKIMHATLTFPRATLMGSDTPPGMQEAVSGFSVSFWTDHPAEADRIFTALSEGAAIRMPIQETDWAYRFGMLVDRFGIPWMISCNKSA